MTTYNRSTMRIIRMSNTRSTKDNDLKQHELNQQEQHSAASLSSSENIAQAEHEFKLDIWDGANVDVEKIILDYSFEPKRLEKPQTMFWTSSLKEEILSLAYHAAPLNQIEKCIKKAHKKKEKHLCDTLVEATIEAIINGDVTLKDWKGNELKNEKGEIIAKGMADKLMQLHDELYPEEKKCIDKVKECDLYLMSPDSDGAALTSKSNKLYIYAGQDEFYYFIDINQKKTKHILGNIKDNKSLEFLLYAEFNSSKDKLIKYEDATHCTAVRIITSDKGHTLPMADEKQKLERENSNKEHANELYQTIKRVYKDKSLLKSQIEKFKQYADSISQLNRIHLLYVTFNILNSDEDETQRLGWGQLANYYCIWALGGIQEYLSPCTQQRLKTGLFYLAAHISERVVSRDLDVDGLRFCLSRVPEAGAKLLRLGIGFYYDAIGVCTKANRDGLEGWVETDYQFNEYYKALHNSIHRLGDDPSIIPNSRLTGEELRAAVHAANMKATPL